MEAETALSPADALDVLIVDDDPMLADYIALELEMRGCRTRSAASAEEALTMLGGGVDLLVTDWRMPGMDGMELVRQVRAQGSPEDHLHIAMMTGSEDAGARLAALRAGVDDFLYKPVDSVQLELAVSTARRNRMLHRRLNRRNQLLAAAHARTREALQRVQADLDAAAALHERLLPEAGGLERLETAHLYRPAARLGGDTIGVEALGGGKTLFFVIDVRGHGVPAALESFHLHHRLKGFRPDSPEALREAATSLNREMAGRGDDSYATMLAGVVDTPGSRGWIVRAGHPPPVLLDGTGAQELEQGGSVPLGWFAEAEFTAERFDFRPGARLVVYSDGLTDCFDATGAAFGSDRVIDLLKGCAKRPLADLMPRFEDELDLGNQARDLLDDVSLLALEHAKGEKTAR